MKNQQKIKGMSKLIAILMVVLSYNGFAQENKTPTITKTFDLNQPGTLNASSSGGGVTVKTHSQKEVIVQAFVRKNGRILSPSDAQLDDILEDYDLEFEKNGSVITAVVKRKTRFNFRNNTGIALTIITPREMSCNVSSSGGGVDISGVAGTHNFSSSGGGVRIENVTGSTKASSSGGGVTATNQNGDCRLSSSGGGVKLTDAHGSVFARSSGGSVRLNNIDGDVDASSSGGGVSVSGKAGAVKAKSSGGSVRVDIGNLSKELYLTSSGGGVDAIIKNGDNLGLDLDLSSDRVNIDLHNFSGKSEKNRVKGTMNGGGIPVYIRSSGGNINVRYNN
ncbi:DUF4097 family beta strand repeat-containing protein [Maribellus maritimus]|uniref:DUF4097 family beta strand repeat-containing protein n=1 Tax=Maribellus maritimus TaxID=2870838 RepID=UPI001EEB7357|nr:DUF4097 family beta strand repeat-containing protein [Maribellus maritimus]MCG6189806.1 DUF4097 domain-containing protein [Maribellus maritimus]